MRQDQSIKLAGNLKKLLEERNLTLTAACRKIGMNKSTLHNYCNGVVPRNLVKLQELAALLGVSMNELVIGNQSSSPPQELAIEHEEKFEVTIKRVRQ